MEKEIEIRLLNINREEFIKEIEKIGAKKVDSFLQRRFVYDLTPIQENKWIRLRTNGESSTLTIKEVVDKDAIDGTNELEIKVDDFDKTNSILEELNYFHRNYQENYREIYVIDDVEISIDSWPLIPTYVEFEAKKKEDIYELLNKIKYNKDDLTTLDVTSIYNEIYEIDVMSIKDLIFNEKRDYITDSKKKVLFATGNQSKLKRFSKGLLEKGIEVLSLKDIDTNIEVIEDGVDAIENALIKARAYYKETGIPTIGMDDTLYLEGVPEDKQPALFVRRVNGLELNDEEMIKHYTQLVKEYGTDGKLNCKWVYGMAVINENGDEFTYTWDKDNFYMVDIPSDKINVGYPLNSISKYKKLNKYFTEITDEDKETLKIDESHVVDFIASSVNSSKNK